MDTLTLRVNVPLNQRVVDFTHDAWRLAQFPQLLSDKRTERDSRIRLYVRQCDEYYITNKELQTPPPGRHPPGSQTLPPAHTPWADSPPPRFPVQRYASYSNAFLSNTRFISNPRTIPVGCVPTAAVVATRCQYPGLPPKREEAGVSVQSGVSLQGVPIHGGGRMGIPLWTEWHTLLKTLPSLAVGITNEPL